MNRGGTSGLSFKKDNQGKKRGGGRERNFPYQKKTAERRGEETSIFQRNQVKKNGKLTEKKKKRLRKREGIRKKAPETGMRDNAVPNESSWVNKGKKGREKFLAK